MSWISPTFDDASCFVPPPKKKPKNKVSNVDCASENVSITCGTSSSDSQQKYCPKSVEELVVNLKKIKDVESWLESSTNAKSASKYLLLTGPSGCGKTTTLQILCKKIGLKVLEWVTPLDKLDNDSEIPTRYEISKSTTKQFEEYLFRSSRYNSCLSSNITKKIVLVKDFPNAFFREPSSFHDILESFLNKCVNPVVFICNEESHCRKLFSLTMKTTCRVHTVTFNPIPNSGVFKVLKSIVRSHISKATKNELSDETLSSICAASDGDLRSAISKLFFYSVHSNFNIPQSESRGKKLKKPKPNDEIVPTDKDTKLDFFRGVGRVLYPKKTESDKKVEFVHSSDTIVENFLVEAKGFISQLHENYPTKLGSIYDLSCAAERLSVSDILMARWQEKDIFQNYALSVVVQGLMVCNKTPGKGKFGAFKKSQTSRLEVDSKSLELEGKSVFSQLNILDYNCLIDILPYSRALLPNLNVGQLEYVRKTCYFKPV